MSTFNEDVPRFERGTLQILKILMIAFALALAFLMLATVIMRYGMSNPFLAIEEAAVLLGVWLYFVSAAYVTGTRSHICGGALHLIVKTPEKQKIVKFLTSLLCLFVASVALYYAAKYGWFTFDKGRKSTYLQWPKYIWVASMVFGFTMMVYFFIVQSVRDFVDLKSNGKEAS